MSVTIPARKPESIQEVRRSVTHERVRDVQIRDLVREEERTYSWDSSNMTLWRKVRGE